ncbi:MAG: hypothetical protein R2834_05355 [Rhodothermales bacterium]
MTDPAGSELFCAILVNELPVFSRLPDAGYRGASPDTFLDNAGRAFWFTGLPFVALSGTYSLGRTSVSAEKAAHIDMR